MSAETNRPQGAASAAGAAHRGRAHSATATRIEQLLRDSLAPTELEVRDDSAAHAGHVSGGGKGHFRVRIVSESFAGMTPLQRHRRIYSVLAPLWDQELHALALEALTPEELPAQ